MYYNRKGTHTCWYMESTRADIFFSNICFFTKIEKQWHLFILQNCAAYHHNVQALILHYAELLACPSFVCIINANEGVFICWIYLHNALLLWGCAHYTTPMTLLPTEAPALLKKIIQASKWWTIQTENTMPKNSRIMPIFYLVSWVWWLKGFAVEPTWP